MIQKEYYIVPLQKQVALTVWILAKAESFLAVGDRFDMSASTAHYCFKNIIRTLPSLLGTYVKWLNEANIQNIKNVSKYIVLVLNYYGKYSQRERKRKEERGECNCLISKL